VSGHFFETIAGEDREAGIFGESGIGERKIAKNKD
jgi:hypothetical protein